MNRAGTPFAVIIVIIAVLIFLCSDANAWGHRLELRDPVLQRALLADIAIRNHEIRFCVSIDPSAETRFELESIQTQTMASLQAWINPVQQARLIGSVGLRAVDCSTNNFNLMVVIAPDRLHPEVSASNAFNTRDGQTFAVVHINTEYRTNRQEPITDFKTLMRLETHDELVSILDRLSLVQGFSTTDFAKHSGLEPDPVFWSTFRILLHETGHAFGLCDSSKAGLDCDPEYRTDISSRTVMSDSEFVSLTSDDELGIAELFRRLK